MMIVKIASLVMAATLSLASQSVSAQPGEPTTVSTATETEAQDRNVNGDLDRYLYADVPNEDIMYLTDTETGERITEAEADGEYILHCRVVNNTKTKATVENTCVMIGQGDDYYSVRLNLLVRYTDSATGERESDMISVTYPVANRTTDAWLRFRRVGKAKLYNDGGHLNGAQINHKQLFSNVDNFFGVLVGYDDQDGVLPYGEDYACEIRVRVKLSPTEPWNEFWSDTDVHDNQNSGNDDRQENSPVEESDGTFL